jgi:putative hydrolase of the HAD superfamily
MGDNRIKGILLDSGRVLNAPASGSWWMPPNFFVYVDEAAFGAIPAARRRRAFAAASALVAEPELIETEAEEEQAFLRLYRALAEELPELRLGESEVAGLARDLTYNPAKNRFYEDAAALLPDLSARYRLALVSDAWPSLEAVYEAAGLRACFSSFVISSKLGTAKPDPRMYRRALEELGLGPGEVVFVDDSKRNCEGARAVGIARTYLLCRDPRLCALNRLIPHRERVIGGLAELARELERA